MNIQNIFLKTLLLLFLCASCKKQVNEEVKDSPVATNDFMHAKGKLIVDGSGNPIDLKGIAFGNEVWSDNALPETHHTEEDFARVKSMNMNVIRFYLNYKTFENDNAPYQYKQAGWAWIDKNIAWAKKHGIYLILNIHVPQGGFQSQGNGDALWNVAENQNRLTALWKAIAQRYKEEKQIIGFGLVNEPIPTSSKQQWQQLAQRTTNEIRLVDTKHIIFIERCIAVKGVSQEDADLNFPIINDKNIVYEFHTYDPFIYTHQLFTWAGLGDGGKYPDESIISYSNGNWYTATFANPTMRTGNTDWTYIEGIKYKITDAKIKIGLPALVGANVSGKVYFDDLTIKEFDEKGDYIRDIFSLSLDDFDGWGYWSENNTGKGEMAMTGRSNNKSLSIERATSDCNLSNYTKVFIPKPNYSYQINGWVKGENIASGATCRLRIDFITTNSPVSGRNKDILESSLKKYVDWSNTKNLPIYMGEFGVGVPCFANDKGGLKWVNDMIDIARAYKMPFTYHVYHEDNFGLYYGYGTLPNPALANQPLIDFFKTKLQ